MRSSLPEISDDEQSASEASEAQIPVQTEKKPKGRPKSLLVEEEKSLKVESAEEEEDEEEDDDDEIAEDECVRVGSAVRSGIH